MMSGEANADQAGLAREAYDNAKLAADGERNAVFGNLVTGDNDIVGLVAYSIYKQNKHDWLIAFEKAKGRGPNDDEAQCYIIGESTPRRLSTYRHLAQATLDGRGPEVTGAPSSESFTQRGYAIARRNNAASAGSGGAAINYLGWLVAALLALVAAYLAYRYAGVGK